MQKSVRLRLNKFPAVPASLQDPAKPGNPVQEIMVDLADLYHHYYLQSYDRAPPDPDPAQFEHVRYLEPCSAFRFQPNGLGPTQPKQGKLHTNGEMEVPSLTEPFTAQCR